MQLVLLGVLKRVEAADYMAIVLQNSLKKPFQTITCTAYPALST